MSGPLSSPLRVLVKGASTVHTVSYMGGSRGDFAYPRATEVALYAAGVPAEVRCTAMASQLTRTALRTYPTETAGWSPDVVVLNYGHFETIHLFLPHRLERHAHSMADRPGPVRTRYRTALRKVWKLLAVVQQQVDARVPPMIVARRLRRVEDEMVRLIELTQRNGNPLVLVMELTPPGPPFRRWFPGMPVRMDAMNRHLRAAVARAGRDNVRFFPTNSALTELAAAGEVVPDGGHYTPEAHRAIAASLAEEIVTWARSQGLVTAAGPTTPQARAVSE